MGQQALYNEVNFSFMWGTTRRGGGWKSFGNQNVTVRETVLGLFACPADLSPRTDRTNADEIANALAAGTSYLGNLGSNCLGGKEFPCAPPELGDEPDDPRGGNGVIWRKGSATTNEITDGLATTFLAGEQIMAIRRLERLGSCQRVHRLDRHALKLPASSTERRCLAGYLLVLDLQLP